MLGAIAGDIIGSRFEHAAIKSKEFDLFAEHSVFTDDTVHTVALADSLLHIIPYQDKLREYFQIYQDAGYGHRFRQWAVSTVPEPYGSFGNGAAMRISPVGWWYNSLEEVLSAATEYTEVTHNHPQGIRGAHAVAAAIFLARQKTGKKIIKNYIQDTFQYDLTGSVETIRPSYGFDVTCQGSVPQAIIAFLDSVDYEDAVRNAVSLGGDSDTQACIAGSIAEAYYGAVPEGIVAEVMLRLNDDLITIYKQFQKVITSRQ